MSEIQFSSSYHSYDDKNMHDGNYNKHTHTNKQKIILVQQKPKKET